MSAPCQLLCFAIVINTSLLFAVDYYNTKSVISVFLNMIFGVEDRFEIHEAWSVGLSRYGVRP